ncbi:conserved phage C-terminal domain-containing protein [Burkholderia sp. AU44665]|uniref:conserved phage C-terminal domain-containing protein n=1 Tax=Burkholderia sp. AU44665 TaxID=3059203 RepID=UPI00265EB541|nr:conserved phage C-terminal domain-containing protein [Burkholderia sp. AU44665]MDN7700048.1 conserved phage C-terminal domain-containing protein [Burkholderia sp. AU44665]
MPVRILREGILTSERVDLLSPEGEVFYRRLMSVVDDFGRYSANPKLLRAACYPLRLDTVKDADIAVWLEEIQKAGLVALYEVSAKQYLELADFRQQIRAKESKYPNPAAGDKQPLADAKQIPEDAHLDGDGDGDGDGNTSGMPDTARRILGYLNEQADRAYQPVESNLRLILARLKEGATEQQCRDVIDAKVDEWLNDSKWSKYLRPETLFNATKFASYVGQLGPPHGGASKYGSGEKYL